MTEFLSMTLLSAEPVLAAKTQTASSNDAAAEPDQSFAATLAAEVNGKAAEKPAKTSAKTRQNTASDAMDSKAPAAQNSHSELKSDQQKADATTAAEHTDDTELKSQQEDVLALDEKNEAGQSHWLHLLEKAKNLQDRLSKAETAGKATAEQAELLPDTTAESAVTEKAAVAAEHLATQAAAAKLQSDKVPEQADAEAVITSKAKAAGAQHGAIVLNEKLQAEQSSEQHLTAEELKALKLISQSEKAATKSQVAEPGIKQLTAQQNSGSEQDSAEPVETTKNLLQSRIPVHQDTGPDQHKIMAHIEKTLKVRTELTESSGTTKQPDTEKQPDAEKLQSAEADLDMTTVTAQKAPLHSTQVSLQPKTGVATTLNAEQEVEAETDTATEPAATDVKVSVQAQSAAALTAPPMQQPKAAAPEAKVTIEEALKQIQTAAVAAQSEQGSSSTGEHSSHQGSADSIVPQIDAQKSTAAVVPESNSFSNQLKSSLEKTASAITVTGREFVAEQKQVDQLGQKLNLIDPQASNQLKEKMLMMVKDKVHTAEIRLDPSELGSMQIKISVQQDQMSVQFMVQQGNAKELMEQQMPKLRELLQQQGIELSQGSVQQQSQSSSGQEGGRRTAGGHATGSELDSAEEMTAPVGGAVKNSDRVVDYYA